MYRLHFDASSAFTDGVNVGPYATYTKIEYIRIYVRMIQKIDSV